MVKKFRMEFVLYLNMRYGDDSFFACLSVVRNRTTSLATLDRNKKRPGQPCLPQIPAVPS